MNRLVRFSQGSNGWLTLAGKEIEALSNDGRCSDALKIADVVQVVADALDTRLVRLDALDSEDNGIERRNIRHKLEKARRVLRDADTFCPRSR
jgi:hypothetical protein